MFKAPNSDRQTDVFIVKKDDDGIVYFWKVRRVPCTLRGHDGYFARYDDHWHRLHPSSEIQALLRELRLTSSVAYGAFHRIRFSKKDDVALPFIKLWEPPIGWYPEAVYR